MYLYGNNTFEQGNVRGFLQGGGGFVFCFLSGTQTGNIS